MTQEEAQKEFEKHFRSNQFSVAGLRITYRSNERIEGSTPNREKSTGQLLRFRIALPDREHLDLAWIAWANHERETRTLLAANVRPALRRLEHGLRMGIASNAPTESVAELKLAKIDPATPNEWSTAFQASLAEIATAAGTDPHKVLKRAGANAIGPKSTLLGDTGTHRNFLCVTFHPYALWVPIAAYVLTRVLPLYRGYTHDGDFLPPR